MASSVADAFEAAGPIDFALPVPEATVRRASKASWAIAVTFMDHQVIGWDDLHQIGVEAILKEWAEHEHLRHGGYGWMDKVARWAMIDAIRSQVTGRYSQREHPTTFTQEHWASTEDEYDLGYVDWIVQKLTPRQKQIVRLLLGGMQACEVAQALGLSHAAVTIHMKYAKDRLIARGLDAHSILAQ